MNELESFYKIKPSLIRGNFDDTLKHCLEEFDFINTYKGTKIKTNGFVLKLNREKTGVDYKDISKSMLANVINYIIPRSEIEKAKNSDNFAEEFEKLRRKSMKKFVDYWKKDGDDSKSGEGGELLLFLLAEQYLQLPQILTKMNFKTSRKMHIHGADGLHLGLSEDKSKLALYYGESKIYSNRTEAVSKCFSSIAPLLKHTDDEEDLDLLQSYLDLGELNNPEKMTERLKEYFDYDNYKNRELTEFRGLCLVGFDFNYNSAEIEKILENVNNEIQTWLNDINNKVIDNKLSEFEMNLFFVPMPSVQDFRNTFFEFISDRR